MTAHAWNGVEVPAGETPETRIKVWRVSTTPSPDASHYLIRGWQEMLEFVQGETGRLLEDDIIDGEEPEVQITVKLVEMTVGELEEIEVGSD